MNTRLKALRLRQVSEAMEPWAGLTKTSRPKGGWVRAIRQALGMTGPQFGRRLGLTRQGVEDLERREAGETVSLAALADAARALNADLIYAIVPRKSLAETLRDQAHTVAARELGRVAHSMRLEAQEVSGDELARQIAEREEELLRTWSRRLWDDDQQEVRKEPQEEEQGEEDQ